MRNEAKKKALLTQEKFDGYFTRLKL